MSWRGEPASSGATKNFISRLMRSSLPTASDRERWDSSESGACLVAKYGWDGSSSGTVVGVLVRGDGVARWQPATLLHDSVAGDTSLEVRIDGSALSVPVWMARQGRWVEQTIAHTVGASLEFVDVGTGEWDDGVPAADWRARLWHGLAKHVKRLAVAAAAVLRCADWKAVVEEEPYARAVAAALAAGGHVAMASTVQRVQDAIQRRISSRLAGAIQRDLPGCFTAPECMVMCCLLRWPLAECGATTTAAVVSLQHWVMGVAGEPQALPRSIGGACRDAASKVCDELSRQPACSRLDRRLQRYVSTSPPGLAVVEDELALVAGV